MDKAKSTELAEKILSTWNAQDVEAVVGCYTEDMVYIDPNTRGPVQGADAMRRSAAVGSGAHDVTE